MAVKPATSETVYEPVPFWAKVPHGFWFKEATSVSTDLGAKLAWELIELPAGTREAEAVSRAAADILYGRK